MIDFFVEVIIPSAIVVAIGILVLILSFAVLDSGNVPPSKEIRCDTKLTVCTYLNANGVRVVEMRDGTVLETYPRTK